MESIQEVQMRDGITNALSRHFYETRMAQEVSLEPLGDEWAGYKAIVTGQWDLD
jgi:hypothetical protein